MSATVRASLSSVARPWPPSARMLVMSLATIAWAVSQSSRPAPSSVSVIFSAWLKMKVIFSFWCSKL